MPTTVRSSQEGRSGDLCHERDDVLDQALDAANLQINGAERQRLIKVLRRLAPASAPAPVCGENDFARVLQELARG